MRWTIPIVALVAIAAVAGAVIYLMWDLDWRWRPVTLTKDTDAIGQSLAQAGWVSPHLTGPKLYVLAYRACAPCSQFETTEFPALQAAEVDTRVIMVAPADLNGAPQSTPAERATVAELWTNRSWKLWQQWQAAPAASWPATGIAPADGDAARTAVISVGRQLVTSLTGQLKDNGVTLTWPMLVWQAKDGSLQACACADQRGWAPVVKALAG
ncbi:MAG TPA: hypothetical protein VGL58_12660 [Caulobacteraceae bacterium]|jgi:hypothetical protein